MRQKNVEYRQTEYLMKMIVGGGRGLVELLGVWCFSRIKKNWFCKRSNY